MVLLSILFFSCQREEISNELDGEEFPSTDTTVTINELNAEELKGKTALLQEIEKFNTQFKTRKGSNPVIADYAKEVISGKDTTYTFKLRQRPEKSNNPTLYNIVFSKRTDCSFRTLGVMYDLTTDQAEAFRSTKQLKGKIRIIFFTISGFHNHPEFSTRKTKAPVELEIPGENICEKITEGMNCGTLDEAVVKGSSGGGGGFEGGGGGGFGFGFGSTPGGSGGSIPIPNHRNGGGSGYTVPVDEEEEKPQEVIIDSTFKTNGCLNEVYKKLKKGNNSISDYIGNFIPDNAVANLTLRADDDFAQHFPDDTYAIAMTSEPDNYTINIIFNTDYDLSASTRNFSSIVLAQAFIHEIIHAEMYRKLLSVARAKEVPWTEDFIKSELKDNFPGLADYYTRWWLDLPPDEEPGAPQHQIMAEEYRGVIVKALKAFDTSHQYSESDYRALSWMGLKDTEAWKEKSRKGEGGDINKIIQEILQEKSCM